MNVLVMNGIMKLEYMRGEITFAFSTWQIFNEPLFTIGFFTEQCNCPSL